MEYVLLLGRILFGGFFALAGLNHFLKLPMMSGYAASNNVPFPTFSVVLSGIMIILGGLGVILGIYVEWSLVLIILFLIPVTFMMHQFWKITDPATKAAQMMNFQKNIAFLGATLILLALVMLIHFPLPLSLFS